MKHAILQSLKKHSPTLLCVAAAGGVALTAVLAAKGTPKAVMLLEKAKTNKSDELTVKEAVITVAPAYIPAIVSGTLTIACIFGANILNKHQQAALTSAYALLDNSFKIYRNKVNELYGDEADLKVREAISRDRDPIKVDNPLDARSADQMLFYEEYSGEYFWRTMEEVIEAEYHFNRNFILRGGACINELFDFFDIPHIDKGDRLGWSMDAGLAFYGYQWIDFEHELVKSEDPDVPSYVRIRYPFEPIMDYEDIDWYDFDGYTKEYQEPMVLQYPVDE